MNFCKAFSSYRFVISLLTFSVFRPICWVENNQRIIFLSDWQTCINSILIIPGELESRTQAIILSILIFFQTAKADSWNCYNKKSVRDERFRDIETRRSQYWATHRPNGEVVYSVNKIQNVVHKMNLKIIGNRDWIYNKGLIYLFAFKILGQIVKFQIFVPWKWWWRKFVI